MNEIKMGRTRSMMRVMRSVQILQNLDGTFRGKYRLMLEVLRPPVHTQFAPHFRRKREGS